RLGTCAAAPDQGLPAPDRQCVGTGVERSTMSTKVPPVRLARAVERLRHHLKRLHQRSAPAPAVLLEMIISGWRAQAITVAAELHVADALAHGPLPIDELARRVDANANTLDRLM